MIIRLPPLKTLRAFEKDSIRKRARTKRVSIEFPFVITEKQYCYNYWQNAPHQLPRFAAADCMCLYMSSMRINSHYTPRLITR